MPGEGDRAGGRWRALVVGGLALMVFALVLTQVIARVVIPPLAVFSVIFLLLAVLVARLRTRWPLIVSAVVVLGYAASSVPFLAEDLPHPASTGSFVPAALALIGGTVASVAALVGFFRPAAGGSRGLAGFGGLAAVAIVVVSFAANAGVEDAARQPDDVVITAQNTQYPEATQVRPQGAVFVENRDAYRHTFVIEGTDYKHELPAQSSRRFNLTLDPGTYRLYCDVAGHEIMEGQLVASE